MSDAGVAAPVTGPQKVMAELRADSHWLCVDMSGSIRSLPLYASFVSEDVRTLAQFSDAPELCVVIWGSTANRLDDVDALVAHLADSHMSLGGTEPSAFVDMLPSSGCIDLSVVTDGEVSSCSIDSAREALQEKCADLRIRKLTLTYVNKHLDYMNMGLSVIFGDLVEESMVVRIKDQENIVSQMEAPVIGNLSIQDILDKHIGVENTSSDMTLGCHYLSQIFSTAENNRKLEIRRLVRDHMERYIRQHRTRQLTAEDEQKLLAKAEEHDWAAVKAPFVGNTVHEGVKLVQAVCQKFLNETRHCGVVRISAYAPVAIKGDDAAATDEDGNPEGNYENVENGEEEEDEDEVLIDDITFCALEEDAVMVLPAQLEGESSAQRRQQSSQQGHIEAALGFDGKMYADNIISLRTLFNLRQAETGRSGPLRSSMDSFCTNPFNRTSLSCVFLLPVSCSALPPARLIDINRWNANMVSRYTRCGRYVPSLPLSLALILERTLVQWQGQVGALADVEERARLEGRVERVRAACREYLGQQRTPMTFTVGLPVVVEGTFRTAAALECRVLLSGLDPALPLGVLSRLWVNVTEPQAEALWLALLPYAGLGAKSFPRDECCTLRALSSAMEWKRSGRNRELRERKGLAYSIGMYTKYLDHLLSGGCDPLRLVHEDLFVRLDLFGVPVAMPLLCLHGEVADACPSKPVGKVVLCHETGKPTLLDHHTLDMWYVGLPALRADLVTRASYSFHRASWQLVRKRAAFPAAYDDLLQFVCSRARLFAARREDHPSLLPTAPCRKMREDVERVFETLQVLRAALPDMTAHEFMKMLNRPRRVCENGLCCDYIRRACTQPQLDWINEHATFQQIAGDSSCLSGEVSYRQER